MNRKNISIILILISLIFLNCSAGSKMNIKIEKLTCEYLNNPIGIDAAHPRLSWILSSKQRGQSQTAYQVLVASTPEKLKSNDADLWDSGKINSNRSVQIVYEGKELFSGKRYYWKIRVWDIKEKVSAWSASAHWEMGLMDSLDWKAQWIGAPGKENNSLKTDPAPYLRKVFTLSKSVKTARAYICGLGYYELYLNSKKVGDHVLSPNQTNYDQRDFRNMLYPFANKISTRVLYETFDITSYLNQEKNVAGIILGNGWYNQRDRVEEGYMWYGSPRMILQINIEYEDGSRQSFISDETWKFSTGPIIHDGIFTGEIYDARLELNGWSKPDFDDSAWNFAQIKKAPQGQLRAQMSPPDKIIKTIQPVTIINLQPGKFRYDFGEMISGWARLKIKGKKGTKVSLRFIEEFGEKRLGKGIVPAKDTPNFIANRLFAASAAFVLDYVLKNNYTVPEVDAITGPPIGNPKTATFRLFDLVGIDVWEHVGNNLASAIQDDELAMQYMNSEPVTQLIHTMVENGWLGNKVKQGFLDNGNKSSGIWRISNGKIDLWLKTVEKHTYCTFRDIDKIRVGVKTTADKIFIRNTQKP